MLAPSSMQAEPTAAVCFGKLPMRGDFIRHHVGGANGRRAVQAIDAWLQRGLVHGRQRQGPRFDDVFDAAPGYNFVMDLPAGDDLLAGSLRPSRDSAGRRYTFLVAVAVPRSKVDGRRLPSWPFRYNAFFSEANTLSADLVEGRVTNEQIPERLEGVGNLFDRTPFVVDYEYRLRQALVWPLWSRTWGSPEDGRKYVLIKNLIDVLGTSRGRPVRLPLGFPHPTAADAMDGSFWLEACWHLQGKPPAEPTFFWSEPGVDGALYVTLAPPPPALLAELFTPEERCDDCLRLDDPLGKPTADAALALPPMHSAILEDETLSFRAFIDKL